MEKRKNVHQGSRIKEIFRKIDDSTWTSFYDSEKRERTSAVYMVAHRGSSLIPFISWERTFIGGNKEAVGDSFHELNYWLGNDIKEALATMRKNG